MDIDRGRATDRACWLAGKTQAEDPQGQIIVGTLQGAPDDNPFEPGI